MQTPELTARVAAELRRMRSRKKMTQQELAYRAGLAVRTIPRVESGGSMTMETFFQVCHGLGVKPVTVMVNATGSGDE